MGLEEVKRGVEVSMITDAGKIVVTKIQSVPYKIGSGPWICILENGEKVPINSLRKLG
jgi:hypothetical protein